MSSKKWIMHQEWEDLIFLHWPVPAEILARYIPSVFELDEFDGSAWIAVVPFRMNHIRFKNLPSLPFGNQLLELNVRTYVTYKGEPGVYFLTLDADHPLGVFLARTGFSLPYVHASMRMDTTPERIHFSSRRIHKGYPNAHFHMEASHFSPAVHPAPGSLLYWLTERYALWTVRGQKVYKGPIQHKHWRLQKVKVDLPVNQLLDFLPSFVTEQDPTAYYSKTLQTRIFPFERVK
ncbi:DUF2071 domain-containing protein [Halobacillus sp. ACCC02827]|uniref:YqjF family protein n=1 Tax=Bacillaceae TaxID=186817 RepID=UPI000401F8E9|nr:MULTISPECIES: DUF2071 domain-containing protein [Bacillaceae]QHT48303.1 DUF2071 domain-containing protein [Bacillus sp. SB49]WJE15541.1 DUF2071 domain-containing protein [Halobacillus sp. ACCC02827]